jgi:hypothetical protein
MDYNNVAKVAKSRQCVCCDYTTSKLANYNKHILTTKHKRNVDGLHKVAKVAKIIKDNKQYICDCGMVYKYRQGLHKHHKTCLKPDNNIDIDSLTDKQLIMKLLQENTEMRKALVETCNKTNTINSNNNNSHNKTFNLQFFLNETCKDALNINDFVSSIQLQLTDLETTGRVGYVEGISKIIVHNLKNMEQYRRPMHCSDVKREIMYIKDNDEWTKEDTVKPLLTRAIKIIANENIKKINEWKHKNPDCTDSDSKKNNIYLNIVSNAMSGCTQDETNKNIGKIISNIVKETQIEK